MKRDENDPRAAWPGEDNQNGPWGAEAVLRWLASDGCAAAAAGLDLLPPMDGDERDEAAMARYMQNVYRVMWCHDLYLAISTLREVDPVKADEVADRTVLAAVAGDGYGEWLWQWADERGLDADAICDQARERAKATSVVESTQPMSPMEEIYKAALHWTIGDDEDLGAAVDAWFAQVRELGA